MTSYSGHGYIDVCETAGRIMRDDSSTELISSWKMCSGVKQSPIWNWTRIFMVRQPRLDMPYSYNGAC